MMPRATGWIFICLIAAVPAAVAAEERRIAGALIPPFDEVGVDQRLGNQVPPELIFRDETGRSLHLGDYFAGKPIILSLNYYRCPMLCSLALNGLASSLSVVGLQAGRDFTVITVSIDPRETPELAAATKKSYLERYQLYGAAGGWHFMTGEEESIERLARAVGFRYVYDAGKDQYAHAAGVMVLTPRGKLARYLYGIEYAPRDLRLALVEASAGRMGSLADRMLLLCYQYDPATGRYGAMAYALVRLGGLLTILIAGSFVIVMLRREKRRAGPGAA